MLDDHRPVFHRKCSMTVKIDYNSKTETEFLNKIGKVKYKTNDILVNVTCQMIANIGFLLVKS